MWGPWRIPGMYGIINNGFACTYVVVIIFFSLWPSGQFVDAGNMNNFVSFTVAMFGVVYRLSSVGKERVQRASGRGELKRSENVVTNVLKVII